MSRLRLASFYALIPYVVVSLVHVTARFAHDDAVSTPTKALLMPALAFAVWWMLRGTRLGLTGGILFAALGFSWLGDEAGLFFPFAPTLPLMLLFFGLAHLGYIWIFWRRLAVRPVPAWALVYALWYGVLLAVLWPHAGALLPAIAVYGLVLGGTAVAASRCRPLIVWGGAFFLTSDTILAFEIFLPSVIPAWASGAVMLTYCLGQGLLATGAVLSLRAGRVDAAPPAPREATV
ncbi:lysoplasmalogenase [Microbacterium hominis]|uniref:Lysoplasmalogenase n=1 Tax=Microbacterium hominis TaxID=162426 RepID=A0A7D4PMT0_9MICO|nr:lysoplasmalogenase [Microbacterium hominis]QKJ19750.1 lysoplasmalogenase [Microbacterium hominis]